MFGNLDFNLPVLLIVILTDVSEMLSSLHARGTFKTEFDLFFLEFGRISVL